MSADVPPAMPPHGAYVAEALPSAAGCDGLVISAIDIRTYPPSGRTAEERAAVALTSTAGLRGRRTATFIVRAYVRVRVGERCSDAMLRDTERLLRAQRFVASAAVTATPDGEGRVRIRVDVVDEVPWVAGASIESGKLTALKGGTRNFDGRGVTVVGSTDWGGPFRPAARVHLGQFGALGRPAFADVELAREHLGGRSRVGYTEPFVTNAQTRAIRAGAAQEIEYVRLVREGNDDAAARVRQSSYNLGMLWRVGADQPWGLVGLGGLMVMGTDVSASEQVVVVTDSGVAPTADTELAGRYPHHDDTRLAGIFALRALRFRTATRFDALRAQQDIGSGVQLEVLYAPSVGSTATARDVLAAADLYLGVGSPASFASVRARVEGRRVRDDGRWEGVVGAAQLTWHHLTSARRTRTFSVSGARVDRLPLPGQFTFRDGYGGLIGFADSREAGGRRLVVRLEERLLFAASGNRVALAVGAFADAGKLWAGDVPYGSDSPIRASAGVSVFAALPASGKRLYRLDFGVPLNPQSGASGFAVRIGSSDRTGSFWREPRDVARVRANPATLLRW